MTNRQVFAAFAAQRAAEGAHVRSVALPDAGAVVLYSYGTPVALIEGSGESAVFDGRSYSRTTSRQCGQARAACREAGVECGEMPHEDFRAHLAGLGLSLAGAR